MTIVTKEASKRIVGTSGMEPNKAWEWLAGEEAQNRFTEYLLPTDYTCITPEVAAFAEAHVPDHNIAGEEQEVYDWLLSVCSRIHAEFVYDPYATNVYTIASDMIRRRRGVCQDFAHLMIAICRSMAFLAAMLAAIILSVIYREAALTLNRHHMRGLKPTRPESGGAASIQPTIPWSANVM